MARPAAALALLALAPTAPGLDLSRHAAKWPGKADPFWLPVPIPGFGIDFMKPHPHDDINGSAPEWEVRYAMYQLYDGGAEREEVGAACTKLISRGFLENNKDWLREIGAINITLRAMERWYDNAHIQFHCSKAVGMLSLFHAVNQDLAGEMGAVEKVVDIMKRWPEEPIMQLGSVSGCFMDFSEKNRRRWSKAGGIEVNLASARRFWDKPAVVLEAAYAFSSGTASPNEEAFVKAGGIEMAMQLMYDHANSYGVRAMAMKSTRPIVRHSPELRAELVQRGFITSLASAMRAAPYDKQVTAVGCDNLKHLAKHNTSHRDMIINEGTTLLAYKAISDKTALLNLPASAFTAYTGEAYGSTMNLNYYTSPWQNIREDCVELLSNLVTSNIAVQQLHAVGASAELREILDSTPSAHEKRWFHNNGGAVVLRALGE